MANPRIDELRKRLDREPGSRLFGQLAEELRKDGELVEAIRVARIGLAAHPNYPSARMTLGRALFDTGDLAAARAELELVLRGAPENILASRMLAECLEGLGDHGAALLQFRAALRLAPGDRQTEMQIRSLEQRLAGAGGGRPAPPPIPTAAAPPVAAPVIQRPPQPPPPPATTAAPPPPPFAAPVRPASPPLPAPAPPSAPAAARPAPAVTGPPPVVETPADFDDVFETAPSWQRAASTAAAPEGEALLLLEDEAPTLPGSRHVAPASSPEPPRVASPPPPPPPTPVVSAPPEPPRVTVPSPPLPVAPPPIDPPRLQAPVLAAPEPKTEVVYAPTPREALDFGAPPPVSPQAPLTIAFEPAHAVEALAPEAPRPMTVGADTVAGVPAYVPPAPVVPASPLPQEPAMTMLPDELIPTAAVGESTAAFAALSATIPPAPQPGTAAPPTLVDELDTVEPMAAVVDPSPEAPVLSTPTLAELYFDQGFKDKAIQVYEELLEREPQNERARARLIEIKALSRHVAEEASADPRAERRLTLERKIARLEQMLAAVRRG